MSDDESILSSDYNIPQMRVSKYFGNRYSAQVSENASASDRAEAGVENKAASSASCLTEAGEFDLHSGK